MNCKIFNGTIDDEVSHSPKEAKFFLLIFTLIRKRLKLRETR